MKTNLRAVPSGLEEVTCFRCSGESHLILFKKKINEKGRSEKWKEGERFICDGCGHTYWYDGEELIMEPCGDCEENVWSYIESLMCGEYLNFCEDRVRCQVCGKLFKLRKGKLVHAPIDFSLYQKNS